ncbi:helix-turn-helix transcriptional regulator [Luteipulveratus sp. YIM 133132]|uniref:Helix-turn-helix transcriptional regulator n=1 Tax=Luteipulveratus flavus TaxID=3031728 RepID=A0ABT6C4W3_9MICO|nr:MULTISPECIES: helix-turn-helix transcriptional regulator [unclassified Luteipulveratus]MDE9367108.1 helix-turn-helix transcriptional regulator [Luteipulveratus sp. YIM 133132]MDF8263094.1 helix-turn-helix transcriptional regulator [Luteipulveratus sp. YIM 133296]
MDLDFPVAPAGLIQLKMPWRCGRRVEPTFAVEVQRARADIDAVAEIAMLLRRHRRELGLSQRELSEQIGLSKSMVGRLEADAAGVTLGAVLAALATTGHTLRAVDVAHREVAGAPPDWPTVELVARDLAGRRFPATMDVRRSNPAAEIPYRWSRYRDDEPPWHAVRSSPADSRADERGA